MRRQDIQLLASARQGDIAARCEVGRRYLLGADGFPHHVATGLDYLSHPSVKQLPEAARIIAESLPLQELLSLQQEPALAQAARAGSALASAKLDAWERLRRGDPLDEPSLSALQADGAIDVAAVLLIAVQRAFAEGDLARVCSSLALALALSDELTPELAESVAAAVRLAEAKGEAVQGIAAEALIDSLDQRAAQGDRDAAYALGRGFCGIECGAFGDDVFAERQNMRRGAAFLLRAADGGCDDAWLHLYRLHADHRLSVANPQMARFFLEKAAARGQAEAQRKLGALMLRESASLATSEQAIDWLHQAASQGDAPAKELLESLVLPVEGRDEEAVSAIEQIRRSDPWLATRLELAREFGLTKLEALCMDPAEGLRPWGIVVGKNPFIAQSRLSAPRAVPATSETALAAARQAASLFGQARREALAVEGDLRRRSVRQRRAFEKHSLDDAMFFANATSMTLESLRLGPKWAFRARQPLRTALAS